MFKDKPFIVESAPARKGPWTRAAGGRCFELAKYADTSARGVWGPDQETRPWVRVRRYNSDRAVHLFEGGTYKPVGENGRFGWVRQ